MIKRLDEVGIGRDFIIVLADNFIGKLQPQIACRFFSALRLLFQLDGIGRICGEFQT